MAPLSSLNWLSALKSTQLKSLAAALGTRSSGTKAVLIEQLRDHLLLGREDSHNVDVDVETHDKKTKSNGSLIGLPWDIISIDMGIRNLAYCHLSLPSGWPSPSKGKREITRPIIKQWDRIAVSSRKVQDQHPRSVDLNAENHDISSPAATTTKESFEPLAYSSHAYNLIARLLNLPASSSASGPSKNLSTATILIERQRFRSMGASAVLEWTLRVNMFEAMLYAVLQTLRRTGVWTGQVHPIVPGRVGGFWLGDEEGVGKNDDSDRAGESSEMEVSGDGATVTSGKGSKSKKQERRSDNAKVNTKLAKIRVVESWLESWRHNTQTNRSSPSDHFFDIEAPASNTALRFLEKRQGNGGRRKNLKKIEHRDDEESNGDNDAGGVVTRMGKLDDLADCLMQGMAWVKWEENRRRLLEKGEEGLRGMI